jgi:hypothetical protein
MCILSIQSKFYFFVFLVHKPKPKTNSKPIHIPQEQVNEVQDEIFSCFTF